MQRKICLLIPLVEVLSYLTSSFIIILASPLINITSDIFSIPFIINSLASLLFPLIISKYPLSPSRS